MSAEGKVEATPNPQNKTPDMSAAARTLRDGELAGLQQPANYVRELESLRGWAILLVVIFHYAGMVGHDYFWPFNKSETLMALAKAGNSGVSLFFVLSGFLLSRPFLQRIEQQKPMMLASFFRARALRILPLYLIVVSLAWIITGKAACLKAMVFIPIGFQAFPFSVPWWSLSTEVQFYLVLPLLMVGLSYPRLRIFLLTALFSGLALYAYIALNTPLIAQHAWLSNNLPGRASAFVAGGLAAWITVKRENRPDFPASIVSSVFLLALVLLSALLYWYGKTDQQSVLKLFPLYHYAEATLWSVVLFCLIQSGCILKNVFCNSAFDSLGRISYSLYLVHVPVIFYMLHRATRDANPSAELDPLVLFLVIASFVTTLVISAASYHYIERPFLALKARRQAG